MVGSGVVFKVLFAAKLITGLMTGKIPAVRSMLGLLGLRSMLGLRLDARVCDGALFIS